MKELIRVHAKAQNRCALGIIHAYMLIKPEATLADLRKAFPNSLNPDKGVDETFIYAHQKGTTANWEGFFKEESELITTGDGKAVSLVKMWTKPSLERLINHARQYGIVVASFEEAEKGFGKRGEFHLEYLNGFTPKKATKKWWWLLLVVLVLLAMFFAWRSCSSESEAVSGAISDVVVDPAPAEETVLQVEHIEKKVNEVLFNQGQATLKVGSEDVIKELANLLAGNEGLKLRVEGHASDEGASAFNESLSLKRAEAIVAALQAEGVAPERLEAIGKGTTEPVSDNPELNRRVELIIYQ